MSAELDRLKQVDEDRKNSPKLQLKDFYNRMVLRGILTSVALSWFTQLTGVYIITNYASHMFDKSGSALSISVSSIILIIVQIVGGSVSAQLGDTFSRKTTIRSSLCGCLVGFFILSIYSYMRAGGSDISSYTWLPIMVFSFIIFISSAGIAAIVNTCVLENFPPKVCCHILSRPLFYFDDKAEINLVMPQIFVFNCRFEQLA